MRHGPVQIGCAQCVSLAFTGLHASNLLLPPFGVSVLEGHCPAVQQHTSILETCLSISWASGSCPDMFSNQRQPCCLCTTLPGRTLTHFLHIEHSTHPGQWHGPFDRTETQQRSGWAWCSHVGPKSVVLLVGMGAPDSSGGSCTHQTDIVASTAPTMPCTTNPQSFITQRT